MNKRKGEEARQDPGESGRGSGAGKWREKEREEVKAEENASGRRRQEKRWSGSVNALCQCPPQALQ